MRIVQLSYSLWSGGAERFLVNLANELSRQGHEVFVLQLLDDSREELNFNRGLLSPDVKYVNAKLETGFSINKVKVVCRLLKSIRPDVIHGHLNVMPYLAPLLFRKMLGREQGIKFVHTIHNLAQFACGSKYQKPFNKLIYRNGTVNPVTISSECSDSFHRFYSLSTDVKIENGTASVVPSPSYEKVKAQIEQLKTDRDTKVFVHVGRCCGQKNQELLIQSFNRFRQQVGNVILIVIGREFDLPSNSYLRNQAGEGIYFVGEKNNVGDYLLQSDYFCLSSNYEGLPISLLEAMSAGVTPVCTAVGGIKDIITDGRNGYLAGELTVESYTDALLRAYASPIDTDELIGEFNKTYSIENCANKYLELYSRKN